MVSESFLYYLPARSSPPRRPLSRGKGRRVRPLITRQCTTDLSAHSQDPMDSQRLDKRTTCSEHATARTPPPSAEMLRRTVVVRR